MDRRWRVIALNLSSVWSIWVDKIKLPIELVYYPPYHSKYNPVEHCWGVLERHWNGALLSSAEVVCEWTKTMRWAGIAPNVCVFIIVG